MRNASRRKLLQMIGGMALAVMVPSSRHAFGSMWSQIFGESSQIVSPITPNDSFYITSYRTPPFILSQNWLLSIKGLVKYPLAISYPQLLARPRVSEVVTVECVGNDVAGEAIGTAEWEGVPLKTLLDEAKVDRRGYDVLLRAADGYTDSLTLDRVMTGDVLVAHRMNGETLPSGHGYPARIIVPGHYGMKHVQWLTDIEVVSHDYHGYYPQKGWTDDATVKTMSWISDPQDGDILPFEKTMMMQGYAFAGTRGIRAVEVTTNGGQSWTPATLMPELSPYAWVFWKYRWTPDTPGDHRILVRAIDGTGERQTNIKQKPFPDGASGIQEVIVTVE